MIRVVLKGAACHASMHRNKGSTHLSIVHFNKLEAVATEHLEIVPAPLKTSGTSVSRQVHFTHRITCSNTVKNGQRMQRTCVPLTPVPHWHAESCAQCRTSGQETTAVHETVQSAVPRVHGDMYSRDKGRAGGSVQ